jgi:plasmid replication initiation protein
MVKEVQLLDNAVVTRSNRLIEARYRLSLNEQRVVYAIISLIQPTDEEFNKFSFKVADLARFCKIPQKSAYRELEEVTRTLRSRVITIKEGKRVLQTGWINSALYETGTVEFELDHKLKPYLLGLKKVFTSIKASELMSFKSQYSGRLYELLYQQRAFGSRRLTLEELRDLLGLEPNEYPKFADLRRFIIETAIKDVNKNTPLDVMYEPEKTGKKVTALTFYIKSKPLTDEESLGSDLFDEAQGEIKSAMTQQAATMPGAEELIQAFDVRKIPESDIRDYLSHHSVEYCWAQLRHLEAELLKVADGTRKPISSPRQWLKGCMEKNYAKHVAPVPQDICPKCGGKGGYITQVPYMNGLSTRDGWEICDCKKK